MRPSRRARKTFAIVALAYLRYVTPRTPPPRRHRPFRPAFLIDDRPESGHPQSKLAVAPGADSMRRIVAPLAYSAMIPCGGDAYAPPRRVHTGKIRPMFYARREISPSKIPPPRATAREGLDTLAPRLLVFRVCLIGR